MQSSPQFSFRAVGEYFEALVAQIDTPILKRLSITFFISALEIPRIHDFANRIENLGPFGQADMEVSNWQIEMTLGSPTSTQFRLVLECVVGRLIDDTNIQPATASPISRGTARDSWTSMENYCAVIDSSLWLGLFRLFVSVKSLYVSDILMSTVAAALKELTLERTMEVFPVLGNLYLEGPQSSGPVLESMLLPRRRRKGEKGESVWVLAPREPLDDACWAIR
jgi:hypothetical protein